MNEYFFSLINWIKNHRKDIYNLLWISCLILLIVIVIFQFIKNWNIISKYSWQFEFKYIFFAFVFYSIGLFLTALIWALIIGRLAEIKNVTQNIVIYILTNLAQRLPTPIPYIGARVQAYANLGVNRSITLSAMGFEIAITLLSASITIIITSYFSQVNNNPINNLYFFILILLLGLLVLNPKWLINIFNFINQRINKPILECKILTIDNFKWVGLYILIWINSGIMYFFISKSIYEIPINLIPFTINIFALSGIIGWISQFLFFIPNIGIRQIAAAYLLSNFIPWPVAVVIATMARLCVLCFEIFWVIISSAFSKRYISLIKIIHGSKSI